MSFDSNMNHVFVYGSLMRGFGNHRLLTDAQFQGRAAAAAGRFRMLDLGAFPGLVEDEQGGPIAGELYLVDNATLDRLDRLEGHPAFYRRQRATIRLDGDTPTEAWVYVLADPRRRAAHFVPDNDWRAYRQGDSNAWRQSCLAFLRANHPEDCDEYIGEAEHQDGEVYWDQFTTLEQVDDDARLYREALPPKTSKGA